MDTIQLSNELDADSLISSILNVQQHCQDNRSCRQRRVERMPEDLRFLYGQLRAAPNSFEAEELRKKAWCRRKAWMGELRVESHAKRVREGKVLQKAKKLHEIKGVFINGSWSSDAEEWPDACKLFYNDKWRVQDVD